MNSLIVSNKKFEKLALLLFLSAAVIGLLASQTASIGLLNVIVPSVSVGAFATLLRHAYNLFRAGRTVAAVLAGVGSPVLSFAVYAAGTYVIGLVGTYGPNMVAGW